MINISPYTSYCSVHNIQVYILDYNRCISKVYAPVIVGEDER